jgi:hypothetical protein
VVALLACVWRFDGGGAVAGMISILDYLLASGKELPSSEQFFREWLFQVCAAATRVVRTASCGPVTCPRLLWHPQYFGTYKNGKLVMLPEGYHRCVAAVNANVGKEVQLPDFVNIFAAPTSQ